MYSNLGEDGRAGQEAAIMNEMNQGNGFGCSVSTIRPLILEEDIQDNQGTSD